MSRPSILFVADGGPDVGGGHVMRSLTLARALEHRGARAVFAATPFVEEVLSAFAPDMPRAPSGASAAEGFDAVVLDHFGLDAAAQARIAAGRPSLAIDERTDRALAADLVLDATPGRGPEAYDGLLRPGAHVLGGPEYALVRPAFAALRDEALSRRAAAGEVGRVLVSMGLTDVGGVSARIVQRLLPRLAGAGLDVVFGPSAPSREGLERLAARESAVRLHVGADEAAMAGLCAGADIAVGAGGSSTWERCTVGLPSVIVVLADNQVPGASAVANAGGAEVVDIRSTEFEAGLDRAYLGMMRSPDRRMRMARAAAKLCDGGGAARTAEALLALIGGR